MALTPLDVLTAAGIDPDKAISTYETLREKFDWRPIATPYVDGDAMEITIRVSGNPMLYYFGTDQRAYRLDAPTEFPTVEQMDQREAQIAKALCDVAAYDMRDKVI